MRDEEQQSSLIPVPMDWYCYRVSCIAQWVLSLDGTQGQDQIQQLAQGKEGSRVLLNKYDHHNSDWLNFHNIL